MMKRSALSSLMRFALLVFATGSSYALSYNAAVLDCSGQPAVGNIVLREVYGVDGFPHLRSACTQSLDSAGNFSCMNMTAGRYAIVVTVTVANPSVPDALPIPLMPRETLEEGAVRISEDGQHQKHTFHVCGASTKLIKISIPEKPPSSFINLAFRTTEGDLPTGVSPVYEAESGKVLMPTLAPGMYHLQGYWFASGTDKRYDRIIQVPEDTQDQLDLEQTIYNLSGSIRMDVGTSPLVGMIVAANCGQFGSMVRRRQLVGSDGTFTFRRLDGPECTFSLTGAGITNILSLEVNGKPSRFAKAALQPSPVVNHVNLVASSSMTSLSGRVNDGAVEAGLSVVACNLGSGDCHTSKTMADGTYRFPTLPVGSYNISAWAEVDRVEYRVAAFMRLFPTSNNGVELSADRPGEVSVNLSRIF